MRHVEVIERGWGGHFICANECRFRRNTLVTKGRRHIVVSTVGNMWPHCAEEPMIIGYDRMYETLAFVGRSEGGYVEADVRRQICTGPMRWEIDCASYAAGKETIDNVANDMHDDVVQHVVRRFDALYRSANKKEG